MAKITFCLRAGWKISTFRCHYLGNGARGALTPEFEKCLEFDFTLYAKASGRCATWRTFPFDSGRSYSPRYYYTGNIGQKPDFTFWSRKPSRVFLGILFRYGGTKLIRKLFVYNSYTLFWPIELHFLYSTLSAVKSNASGVCRKKSSFTAPL